MPKYLVSIKVAAWTGRQIGRTLAEKTAGVWKREETTFS